jgi:hypothetical protein
MTTIFEEAEAVVNGPRQYYYDHPLDNFQRIADMWSVILRTEVTWEQVGLMMVALKVVRQAHRPQRDNLVDGVGYWRTIEMAYEEEARRESLRTMPNPDKPEKYEQLELPFDE